MEQLSEYLTKHEIRQAQFAETVSVSAMQVSRWVRGKNQPSMDAARRIEAVTKGAVPVWSWPDYA